MERILSGDELREFAHLWDGSENWALSASPWAKITLTVVFCGESPSLTEIVALRRLREEFRMMPVQELKALLAGKHEIQLGRFSSLEADEVKALARGAYKGDLSYFSSMEAHEIEDRATQLQVPFSICSEGSDTYYTPVRYESDRECILLIDEDEELKQAVTREMMRRGVPIISHVEE